jgi:hypothetical protein
MGDGRWGDGESGRSGRVGEWRDGVSGRRGEWESGRKKITKYEGRYDFFILIL